MPPLPTRKPWKYSKSQDLPKFQFSGGGGGVFCNWKYSKSQDLPKFQFSGGGGYSVTENTQSPKICLNFNFRGGGGVFCNWKYSKSQDLPKFQFSGGGGILYYRIGVFCRIWTKFSTTPAGSCITDSLSHTTYVETNDTNGLLSKQH